MRVFEVKSGGKTHTMCATVFHYADDRTGVRVDVPNEQKPDSLPRLIIDLQKVIKEGEEDYGLAIMVEDCSPVRKLAKQCEIGFPSDGDKKNWFGRKYLGKFQQNGDVVGIFYGNPLSDDKETKLKYDSVKQKLRDTNFLGSNKQKNAEFVDLMEETIKTVLDFKDIGQQLGPARFISNKVGKELQ